MFAVVAALAVRVAAAAVPAAQASSVVAAAAAVPAAPASSVVAAAFVGAAVA